MGSPEESSWQVAELESPRASKMPMELYAVRLSPACRAVWLYLIQHNLPHVLIDVDFSSGENVAEFEQRCQHHEVPVLLDGDITVFDGPTILHYLASQYTNFSGFGVSLAKSMLTESLVSWANAELHRVVGSFYAYPTCLESYSLNDDKSNEVLTDKGLSLLSKHLEHLETHNLAHNSFLTGDRMTVADTFVATVLIQAEWVGFKFDMWPRVKAWLRKVREQEGWLTVHMSHTLILEQMEEQGL